MSKPYDLRVSETDLGNILVEACCAADAGVVFTVELPPETALDLGRELIQMANQSLGWDSHEPEYHEIGSCRECPFTGSTDGEACACHHPVRPFRPPYGVVEDSDAAGTPPPPECPLRERPYVSVLRVVKIEERGES